MAPCIFCEPGNSHQPGPCYPQKLGRSFLALLSVLNKGWLMFYFGLYFECLMHTHSSGLFQSPQLPIYHSLLHAGRHAFPLEMRASHERCICICGKDLEVPETLLSTCGEVSHSMVKHWFLLLSAVGKGFTQAPCP